MWQALRYVLKYKALLPAAIEFLIFGENSTKDGKLTKQERTLVLRHMWKIVKAYEQVNGGKG